MIVGFDEIERDLDAFERLLGSHRVSIRPGSELERSCYAARQLLNAHAGTDELSDAMATEAGQRACGIWLLARAALRVAGHPKFSCVVPHLTLLNDAEAMLASAGRPDDDASNKVLETALAIACLAPDIVELEVDDPKHSNGGRNPDVIARWAQWPLKWGFAAKMVGGDSEITLYENIEKAAKQVRESSAERGAAVVSFKNRLVRNVGFQRPDGTPYRDEQELMSLWTNAAEERVRAALEHAGGEVVSQLFKDDRVVPAVVVLHSGVAVTDRFGSPALMLLTFLQVTPQGAPLGDDDRAVLERMNEVLQGRPHTAAVGAH